MISILTTNVFPGNEHLKLFIQCLSTQTFQDFEWIFLDGHYYKNRKLISELSKKYNLKDVKHYPMCGATHIGRRFHWEILNNSLLLAKNDLFLRMGAYRWFHSKAIELAVENYSKGVFVDFSHTIKDISEFINIEDISNRLNPKIGYLRGMMMSESGMFSCSRDVMLQMNGNDEVATTMVHHEDADLNSRWIHMKDLKSVNISNAMFRIEHNKSSEVILPQLEQNNSYCCGKKFCLLNYPNIFDLDFNPPTQHHKFEYRGFQWKYCPECGAIAPLNSDEYLEYLKKCGNPISPIGVLNKVGRDIRILNEDLQKLNSIQEKLELLTNSHNNKRYLVDTEIIKYFQNENKQKFIRKIRTLLNRKNIIMIDKTFIYSILEKNINKKSPYDNNDIEETINFILNQEDISKYNELFVFELIQYFDKLDDFFKLAFNKFKKIYVSMITNNGNYKSIQEWDDYISRSDLFYSDAEESNLFRKQIDDNNFLNCFFCLNLKNIEE